MQSMWTCVACALIACGGCNDKKSVTETPPPPVAAPADAAAPKVAVVVVPDAQAVAPDAQVTAAGEPDLPMSSDVLPSGEATPNTRVVTGDGYRFQIPADFKRVEHARGTPAYTGTIAGIVGPGSLTLWATSEPFKGTLDALVAREVNTASAAGAGAPKLDSVMFQVEGKVKPNYARRMTITFADRMELRTVSVHDNKAYVMHCETPNVANAWANLGADCITRSTTIHVAPPAAAKPAAPLPRTPNVLYLGSDFTGTARPKKLVTPWVEDTLMPWVKPCLAKLPNDTHWFVAFELGKDGAGSKVSITGGPRSQPVTPADPALVTCVAAVIEAAKIDGTAKGVVKLSSELVVHGDD